MRQEYMRQEDMRQEDMRQEDRPQEDRQQKAVLMIRMDPDPHVFEPHGSVSPRYGSRSGSGPGSFSFLIKVLSRLKKCLQNKILAKNSVFKTEDNVPVGKL